MLGCKPAATIDGFVQEKLGCADLVQEVSTSNGKLVKVTGIKNSGKAVSILIRGSNKMVYFC